MVTVSNAASWHIWRHRQVFILTKSRCLVGGGRRVHLGACKSTHSGYFHYPGRFSASKVRGALYLEFETTPTWMELGHTVEWNGDIYTPLAEQNPHERLSRRKAVYKPVSTAVTLYVVQLSRPTYGLPVLASYKPPLVPPRAENLGREPKRLRVSCTALVSGSANKFTARISSLISVVHGIIRGEFIYHNSACWICTVIVQ